jgi:hypothetical protein
MLLGRAFATGEDGEVRAPRTCQELARGAWAGAAIVALPVSHRWLELRLSSLPSAQMRALRRERTALCSSVTPIRLSGLQIDLAFGEAG